MSKTTIGIASSSSNIANVIVKRDANGTTNATNFVSATTTTTAASGTTVLTAASTRLQVLNGTVTQTYQLPDATTLTVGTTFDFNNNSSAGAFVVNAGSGAIATLLPGSSARITCIVNGLSNGVWDVHWLAPSNAAWGTAGLTVTGTLEATSTVTLDSLTASQAVVTNGSKQLGSLAYASTNTASALVQRDGSGNFSAGTITAAVTGTASGNTTITPANHAVAISSATNALSTAAPTATSGVPLVSNGSSADPSFGTASVAGGGTGQTSLTANNVILGNGASAVQFVAPGASGNHLVSNGTTWTSSAPVIAVYYRGAGTFSSGTNTIGGVSTMVIDTNSAFDGTTFTAPSSRYYSITLGIEATNPGTSGFIFARINKNGSNYPNTGFNIAGISDQAGGDTSVISGTITISLAANDTVTFSTVTSGSNTFNAVWVSISSIN